MRAMESHSCSAASARFDSAVANSMSRTRTSVSGAAREANAAMSGVVPFSTSSIAARIASTARRGASSSACAAVTDWSRAAVRAAGDGAIRETSSSRV